MSSSSEARQPYFAGTKLQALGFASQTFAGFAFIERFKLLNPFFSRAGLIAQAHLFWIRVRRQFHYME
jgi:hypothetical protein